MVSRWGRGEGPSVVGVFFWYVDVPLQLRGSGGAHLCRLSFSQQEVQDFLVSCVLQSRANFADSGRAELSGASLLFGELQKLFGRGLFLGQFAKASDFVVLCRMVVSNSRI